MFEYIFYWFQKYDRYLSVNVINILTFIDFKVNMKADQKRKVNSHNKNNSIDYDRILKRLENCGV